MNLEKEEGKRTYLHVQYMYIIEPINFRAKFLRLKESETLYVKHRLTFELIFDLRKIIAQRFFPIESCLRETKLSRYHQAKTRISKVQTFERSFSFLFFPLFSRGGKGGYPVTVSRYDRVRSDERRRRRRNVSIDLWRASGAYVSGIFSARHVTRIASPTFSRVFECVLVTNGVINGRRLDFSNACSSLLVYTVIGIVSRF